jgi:flagellar hook-basal body complex protein FliE
MGAFDMLGIAGSGLATHQTWLDARQRQHRRSTDETSRRSSAEAVPTAASRFGRLGDLRLSAEAPADGTTLRSGRRHASQMSQPGRRGQARCPERGTSVSRSDGADIRHRARRSSPSAPVASPSAATAPESTGGVDFASMLSDGVDRLQSLHDKADQLAVQAASGDLANLHDYTITATEAAVTTQLTTAVRNKALEAFQEIMRMSI